MSNIYLLFSHRLTQIQIDDAKQSLGVYNFIYLPDNLQKLWSNIPSDKEGIKDYLNPIKKWLKSKVEKKDYILIQGDFGATYIMVNWSFKQGFTPVYSTTERKVIKEVNQENEVISKKVFEHKKYRVYDK